MSYEVGAVTAVSELIGETVERRTGILFFSAPLLQAAKKAGRRPISSAENRALNFLQLCIK